MHHMLTRGIAVTSAALAFTLCSVVTAAAVPNPSPNLPGDLNAKLNSVLGIFMALVIAACVGGFFLAAGKLALAFRHGDAGESVGRLGAVMGACVLIGSASGIVTYLV